MDRSNEWHDQRHRQRLSHMRPTPMEVFIGTHPSANAIEHEKMTAYSVGDQGCSILRHRSTDQRSWLDGGVDHMSYCVLAMEVSMLP
jgi:hypothetical protein